LNPSHALTSTDLNILLTHLARDKQAISFDSNTVKFKSENQALPSPITHQDATIANLRDLITSINTQIPPLTARIATLDAAARAAVASKSETAAKSALRSKKLAETTCVRRIETLAQLEEVFAKIEQAADQVEIVRVMEASATVLKGLHKEVGGAEGVAGVVDALREEMIKVDEVSGIINEVGQEGVVNEMEVDEEFEVLARVEQEKQEKIAREKREKEEADKTRLRLEELEKLDKAREERERIEEEKRREAAEVETASAEEATIELASQEMKSLSLSETSSQAVEEPKEPIQAS
jgi:charged multivesicular body protein 7